MSPGRIQETHLPGPPGEMAMQSPPNMAAGRCPMDARAGPQHSCPALSSLPREKRPLPCALLTVREEKGATINKWSSYVCAEFSSLLPQRQAEVATQVHQHSAVKKCGPREVAGLGHGHTASSWWYRLQTRPLTEGRAPVTERFLWAPHTVHFHTLNP